MTTTFKKYQTYLKRFLNSGGKSTKFEKKTDCDTSIMSQFVKSKKSAAKKNWRDRYQQRVKQSRGEGMDDDYCEQFNDNLVAKQKGERTKVTLNKSTVYVIGIVIAVLFVLLIVDIKLKLDAPKTSAQHADHHSNLHQSNLTHQNKKTPTLKKSTAKKKNCRIRKVYCANVLDEATRGHWSKQHAVTPTWQQDSVKTIRKKLDLPVHMTRKDSRCGLLYPIPNTRLAALCNTTGQNSHCCCEATGFCGNKKEHCDQTTSFNMKLLMSEQNVVWSPHNKNCRLEKKFLKKIWCDVFSRTVKKLIFFGDSQARNFFISLISVLTDNYKDAGISKEFKANLFVQENCTGAYQILNNDCRRYLIRSSKEVIGHLCTGNQATFEISFYPHFDSFVRKDTEKMLKRLHDQENTYVVVSSGTHFNSDHHSFINYFFEYMVKLKNKRSWPHYLVETLHNVVSPQSNTKRHEFNKKIKEKATQLGVEVFDGTNLSKNLASFDGRNYGVAFHSLKANILLHYLYNKDIQC